MKNQAAEVSVTLYLFASGIDDPAYERQEIVNVLAALEEAGTITPKGTGLLGWARQAPTS